MVLRRLALSFAAVVVASIAVLGFTAYKMRAAEPGQPNIRIEKLEGATAAAHIQRILAGNPAVRAAYDRAELSLSSRGFKRVGKPLVIRQHRIQADARVNLLERIVAYIAPTVFAQNQYGESTSEGEIFMDPWDDGNNATWEGSFYVTRYSDGAWALYDWQNDTAGDTGYNMYYAERRGGYKDGGPHQVRNKSVQDKILALFVAPVEAQSTFWRRAKNFGVCYSGSCLGAWSACLFSGAAWGACTAAWCTGSAVACAITTLLPIE